MKSQTNVKIKEAKNDKEKIKLIKEDEAKLLALVKSISTPEDWDGFQLLLKSSDVPDKDLILRVISMYSDPDVRNKEIKKMTKVFKVLADNILPKLRRSKINVSADKVGYSDEELMAIADSKPDSLKVEELLRTAIITKNPNQQLKIYQSFVNIYPNEWRGFNNLGCTYFNMKKYEDAQKAFDKAKQLDKSNTKVLNNLGAVTLMGLDFQKAEELFTSANGAGSEVNYNLGICNIKKADYTSAVKYFGSNCSFNSALAKLLSADFEGATKSVDCSTNKDQAIMFYLKAIIGARQANSEVVYNNLRAAISKDASFNDKAKTDMEFKKYFSDDTFKTIVK